MAKPKHGKLKDIKLNEVSMVDLPANKSPFLFFKQKDAKQTQFAMAAKKIEIEIESNGLVGGTKVKVNGDDLGKLRSFDFSFYGDDTKQPIHASYSKVTESVDGFSRTETYYLTKGNLMDEKTLKALQAYMGKDDIDFEKKVGEEDVTDALALITKHYKDSFPEDLENAVGVIAKRAASSYNKVEKEVEKAGAKFSKDVLKKLKDVISAVEALKGILPEATKTEKATEEVAELTKQVTELKETLAKIDPDNKDEKKVDVAELTKQLKEISDRLKTVEGDGATKKGLTGDDTNEDDEPKGAGEDGKPLWPTITGQGKS